MSVSRLVLALGSGAALAFALHCGSSEESTFTEGDGPPCETVYEGLCGGPCTADTECAAGLHCGADLRCTAECAPNHGCENGSACTSSGRCGGGLSSGEVGDGATDDVFCADTDVALTKTIPKVLFLLDQSSSMHRFKFPSGDSDECKTTCRWSVLKDVLIGPASDPGGLLKKIENQAEIAVKLYSATDKDPNDGDNSYLKGAVEDVCPRFNGKQFDGLSFQLGAYAAVEAMLRPATVDDDTPTGPAIRTVVGLAEDGGVGDTRGFAALPSNAPKVLVLVTDGEPGVCGANFDSDQGRAAVVNAVQQSFAQGVRTFVIAIGDTVAGPHFNEVANAGQGLDPATGDAGAIRPDTQQALIDALEKVVLDARTCSFDLNGKVEAGMEQRGTVTLNGAVVPFGPPDGWRLVNSTRLELLGAACETLKATPDAKLWARFPCGAVSPN